MTISFACATSHAPGMTAWADATPPAQKERIHGGFDRLRRGLDASGTEVLILLTSEHWANFFLDHIGAFCVGRAASYRGPIEPWLKVDKAEIKGDPALAAEIIETSYDDGIEPSFAYELEFDHGTMVPLHFLSPRMDRPVVPVFFNTLAVPQPSARRCLELGRSIGKVAARSHRRIRADRHRRALARPRRAQSRRHRFRFRSPLHDRHGGRRRQAAVDLFARRACGGRRRRLRAVELGRPLPARSAAARGEVVVYEAVKPWATGIGMMTFAQAA